MLFDQDQAIPAMQNLEIQHELYKNSRSRHGRQRMHRLPLVLRGAGQNKGDDYDPKIVALGPYHHGEPHLCLGQSFKAKSLEIFISGSGKDRAFFQDKILQEIPEIRACYDSDSTSKYDDHALAEMMLLDGCFLIVHMEALSDSGKLARILDAIGMVGFSFTVRDIFLIENQVPFRVIALLISLRHDGRKGKDILHRFFNFSTFQDSQHGQESIDPDRQPLHLLEALQHKLTNERHLSKPRKESATTLKSRLYTSRSITDLKSKGMYFTPSPTSCLRDVTFTSRGILPARLHLPARFISSKSAVLFSNLIAYELCPNNVTDYAVTSYINLMKSLIHSAKDVKELRERRILISNLGSDEEVLKVFRELNTYGMENADIFHDVKEKIEQHYCSKAKIWMAELVHTYFESPWTAIALFAAFLLLCLTFAQTLFTIHPL